MRFERPSQPSRASGRVEIKYVIPSAVCAALAQDLSAFTRRDPRCTTFPEGYGVESLYFDTRSRGNYFDKKAGVAHRLKYRIRRYAEDPGALFLEEKERDTRRVWKQKALLTREAYRELAGGILPIALNRCAVAQRFWTTRMRDGLVPWLTVSYRRYAVFGLADDDVRITLDRELHAQAATSFERRHGPSVRLLELGQSVLEFKSSSNFPHWAELLVRKYGLQEASLSKYALGVEGLAARGALSRAQ